MKTVCADPVLIGNQRTAVARTLAPLLQMNEADLYQRLLPRLRLNEKGEMVTNRYVVLQRKVRDETWQKIQQVMNGLSFGVNENKLSGDQRAFFRDLRNHAIFTDPWMTNCACIPTARLRRTCWVLSARMNWRWTARRFRKPRARRHRVSHEFHVKRRAGLARNGNGPPQPGTGVVARSRTCRRATAKRGVDH